MQRDRMLASLAEGTWDLLVIGGGISGAGVAREAALRGLRVALVEQDDFASGTSSRSTKLIHGGLRYLQMLEFRLVHESVQERQRLIEMAPHLARPLEFLFPVWQGDPNPLWQLRLGLILYDAFAGRKRQIPHRALSPAGAVQAEPGLRSDGLKGAMLYYDCLTDDARLTLETVQAAAAAGAVVVNYAQVEAFRYGGGRVVGARVRDRLSGAPIEVAAQKVFAAAGPWADRLRRLDDLQAPPLLRLTKGVHLTCPAAKLPVRRAVVMRGPDGRMCFAVPGPPGWTYAGTTDTDFTGDPARVTTEAADVEYVLATVNRTFPEARLTADDVHSTWAGLRPLMAQNGNTDPSKVSRDYALFTSPSGLVTLAGGKLTAFRAMGRRIVDQLFPATRGQDTLKAASFLPGAAAPQPTGADLARWARETGVTAEWLEGLAHRYGCRLEEVARELPPAGELPPMHRWMVAAARHAVNHEMAVRLVDLLWRRTSELLFGPENGLDVARPAALAMAELLGWTPARVEQEVADYQATVAEMNRWRQG